MQDSADSEAHSLVLDARRDGVATLTLNRPENLNTLDLELGNALLASLIAVAHDKTVRAVVLTGAGHAFCAGGDLAILRSVRDRADVNAFEELQRMGKQIVLAITGMTKPVLACINGPAAGAGFNLALACDLRIASDLATFTQSYIKVGLIPDFGGTYFLQRIVGSARAAELFYTGETLSAEEAAAMGLSRVVPHNHLSDETIALANNLAVASPMAVHGIKQMLFMDNHDDLVRALDEEIRWQLVCIGCG